MREMEIFSLAKIASSFATREKGQEVIRSMYDSIRVTDPKTILVDWDGVSAASPSFVDEFISGIKDASGVQIFFTRVDPNITNLLNVILARRACNIEFAEYPVRGSH